MKTITTIIIAFVITVCMYSQEKQVAFNSRFNLTEIKPEMAKQLPDFNVYENFKEAKIFQISDSVFVLEILTSKGTEIFKTRKTLTLTEFENLKMEINLLTDSGNQQISSNQEGRPLFLLTTTAMGLGFYGWTIPVLLGSSDYRIIASSELLISAGSFFIPYFLTKNKDVTYSNAILNYYGQTRGFAHGAMIGTLLTNNNDKLILGMGLAGSISEGLIGFSVGNKLTAGQSLALGSYGDYGLETGLLTAGLFKIDSKGLYIAGLAGSAAGYFLGSQLIKKDYYSVGDVLMLNGANILGGTLPVSLMIAFKAELSNIYFLPALLGSAGGIYIGDRLAYNNDFSFREGVFIDLSELAGGLLGLGLGYLVISDDNMNVLPLFGTLGGLAGFALSTYSFSKKGLQTKVGKNEVSFNFNVNPTGLFSKINKLNNVDFGYSAPLLTGSIRF